MRYWKPRTVAGSPRVTMLVAAYLRGPDDRRLASLHCLLHSLRAQTYRNWDAIVVHDGPLPDGVTREAIRAIDPRVAVVTPEHKGQHGHPHRHHYACKATGAYVGFTNDDGYYAPVYLEWLASELVARNADLAYCDLVHSHKLWKPFDTAPRRGRIDLGCFLARRALVAATPWKDHSFSGDGAYVEALVARGARLVKVPATLYSHS